MSNLNLTVLVSGVASVYTKDEPAEQIARIAGDSLSSHPLLADPFGDEVTIIADSPMELYGSMRSSWLTVFVGMGLPSHAAAYHSRFCAARLSSRDLPPLRNRLAKLGEVVTVEQDSP